MSNEVVWASDAMVNVRMLRPITHSFDDGSAEGKEKYTRGYRSNKAGESLGAEFFAPEIFVAKHAKTNYEKLDDLFFAGSYWVVSGAVADVMRQFDLGQCNLYPTKVLRKDRKTPIGDKWFCLNFGNIKKAYVGGGRNPAPHIKTEELWHAMPDFGVIKDDMLIVTADALSGPDIWVDPQIYDTFFVSDRLAKALKAAGVARPFGFKKCKIV